MRACVILPTYNEAENIRRVLTKLARQPVDVLVVDDNSPDRTARIAETCGARVLVRTKKEGLGKAYAAGMQYVMQDYDVVFEMDADLSHDPQDIRQFLEAIKNADFVIGSRYITGGATPDWNFVRKCISKGGNMLGKSIAGLPYADCTSGYRAIRTNLLKTLDVSAIEGNGYAFQISLLKRAQKKQARIKEIPITFIDRKKGRSKLGIFDMLEFVIVCVKLRFTR